MFEEVLIQSVLDLALKIVEFLNQLPTSDQEASSSTLKHKVAFSECLYLNTENLQRTLRRALFKDHFKDSKSAGPGKQDEAKIIIRFFERLETELSNVNLL